MYMRKNVQTRRIAHECAEEFKYHEKAQLSDDTNFYFTNIELLFDLRLEKCGPFAGHINLTYDQTRFSME